MSGEEWCPKEDDVRDLRGWRVRQCRRALRGLALDGTPLVPPLDPVDDVRVRDRLWFISRRNPERWAIDSKGRWRKKGRKWGGKRPGAGRPPNPDRRKMRSSKKKGAGLLIYLPLTIPDMAWLKDIAKSHNLSAVKWLQRHVTTLREKMQGLS